MEHRTTANRRSAGRRIRRQTYPTIPSRTRAAKPRYSPLDIGTFIQPNRPTNEPHSKDGNSVRKYGAVSDLGTIKSGTAIHIALMASGSPYHTRLWRSHGAAMTSVTPSTDNRLSRSGQRPFSDSTASANGTGRKAALAFDRKPTPIPPPVPTPTLRANPPCHH